MDDNHDTPERQLPRSPAALRRSQRWWLALPAASGVAFLVLAWHAASVETPTVDEYAHLPAGCAYLIWGRTELYAKNPPLFKCLMAFPVVASGAGVPSPEGLSPEGWGPWLYGARFLAANRDDYLHYFWLARMVTVLATLGTALLIFGECRRAFGLPAAAIATSLFLLTPDILAHGHLATIDLACTGTMLWTVVAGRWAWSQSSLKRWAVAGTIWGVALLVKFTAALLLPVLLLFVVIADRRSWRSALAHGAVLLCATVATINLGMLGQGTLTRLDQYAFASVLFQSVQHVLPGVLPVPLPRDWVLGFDAQWRDTQQGEFASYLFGQWSDTPWWYYHLVALAVKWPLVCWASLLAAVVGLCRRPRGWLEAAPWLLPAGLLVLVLLFFSHLNVGVRYLLPAYPYLYFVMASIWSGRAADRECHVARANAAPADGALAVEARSTKAVGMREIGTRVAGVIAVLVLAANAIAVQPSYINWFNLIAGGPARGWRVLIDSNYDWGQDLYRLPPALAAYGYTGRIGLLYFGHVDPRLYGIDYVLVPPRPVEGVLAVSVNFRCGATYMATAPDGSLVPIRSGHLDWLQTYEPVLRVGSLWVFDTRRGRRNP